jgi:hypothetical protein
MIIFERDTKNPTPAHPSKSDPLPQKTRGKSLRRQRNTQLFGPSQTPFDMISNFPGHPIGSAWALNPTEPVKEPNTHCTGDVKNHLADLNFDVILSSFHHDSPNGLSTYFKLTHQLCCVNENPSFACF